MIVDSHVHFGVPWGPNIDFDLKSVKGYKEIYYVPTADDLIRKMDIIGIDKSNVWPFFTNYDNDFIVRAVKQYPDRLFGMGWMNPWHHKDRRDTVRRFKDMGLIGFKIRPVAFRYNINDFFLLGEVYESASELGMIIWFHVQQEDSTCSPLMIKEVAERFPDLTIVMAHAGFRGGMYDAIRVAKQCKNVFLDQAAALPIQLTEAIKEVGPERVILGSDSPFTDPRVEIEKARVCIEDEKQRELFLGGNFLRLVNKANK